MATFNEGKNHDAHQSYPIISIESVQTQNQFTKDFKDKTTVDGNPSRPPSPNLKEATAQLRSSVLQQWLIRLRLFKDRVGCEDQYGVNRDLGMRMICVVISIASLLIGITIFAIGIFLNYGARKDNWSQFHLPAWGYKIKLSPALGYFVPLMINIIVTLIIEVTGYAHTQSLKWALQREGRLEFNSNLRLFTSTKSGGPNAWYTNALAVCCTVLAYASSSLFLSSYGDDSYVVQWTMNGMCAITLGLSIIGVASISVWAMLSQPFPTWSSNPLNAVQVCLGSVYLERRTGRCMKSVHQNLEPTVPTHPLSKQGSASGAHKAVRRVIWILWAVVVFGIVSILVVFAVILAIGGKVKLLGTHQEGLNGVWLWFASAIHMLDWSFLPKITLSTPPIIIAPKTELQFQHVIWKLLLFCIFQTPLTLSLHCMELLMNSSRDEHVWRTATSTKGCSVKGYRSAWVACTSWQALTLSVIKAVSHWLFSLGVFLPALGLKISPPHLVYLMAFVICATAIVTTVALWKPRGSQPASFGHLQTLADLVDEWSPIMFWGHTRDGDGQHCHAGTASHSLPPVEMDKFYSGYIDQKVFSELAS